MWLGPCWLVTLAAGCQDPVVVVIERTPSTSGPLDPYTPDGGRTEEPPSRPPVAPIPADGGGGSDASADLPSPLDTPPPSRDAGARADAGARPPADAGSAPPSTPPGSDVGPYPSGPYGLDIGDTVADHRFETTDGTPTRLSEVRADPRVKVIVWTSSAAWCGACRDEVRVLNDVHARLASRGVFVAQSLFQNEYYAPASGATARNWRSRLGATFPIWVEPDPPYAGSVPIPMTWVIDAATMRVLHVGNGYDGRAERAVQNGLSGSTR